MSEPLVFEKIGLLFALVRRSIESIGILMNHTKNLLNSTDILQFALVIANEQPDLWQAIVKSSAETNKLGLQSEQKTLEKQFYLLIEGAFVQTSLGQRSEWLAKLLKCQKTPSFLESIFKNTTQFKYYCQWLVVGSASDDPLSQDIRQGLKKLHGIQLSQMYPDYDSQIARFNFLARFKPVKVVSELVKQMDEANARPVPMGAVSPKVIVTGNDKNNNAGIGGTARIEDFEDKESAEVDSD